MTWLRPPGRRTEWPSVIQTHCISKHFNLAQHPPLAPKTVYDKGMKNEISVPVYETLEALLAAETALAAEAAETASDFPSWGAAMGEWADRSQFAN